MDHLSIECLTTATTCCFFSFSYPSHHHHHITSHYHRSNNDSGTFGAVFIVCGLIGAGIAGKLMERTHAYRTILKAGVGLCVCTTIFLVAMLSSHNYWPLLIAFGLLGLSILPLLPVMMENCAECTYPVPEDLSMGILFVGMSVSQSVSHWVDGWVHDLGGSSLMVGVGG